MAKAYYSRVLPFGIEVVWAKIRDFNDDRWSGEVTESRSENDKSGSTVGTVRLHVFGDKTARSDLQAYSEVDHYFTYGFVGTPPLPLANYRSTLRLTPITEDGTTLASWSATFDSAEHEKFASMLERSYKRWLEALNGNLQDDMAKR